MGAAAAGGGASLRRGPPWAGAKNALKRVLGTQSRAKEAENNTSSPLPLKAGWRHRRRQRQQARRGDSGSGWQPAQTLLFLAGTGVTGPLLYLEKTRVSDPRTHQAVEAFHDPCKPPSTGARSAVMETQAQVPSRHRLLLPAVRSLSRTPFGSSDSSP